jgi:hypothetical protein
MVNLSSSDTEEALELLSLSSACGYHSPLLNLWSSSDSELFEDWPKANDMAASVYVALTADVLSSPCINNRFLAWQKSHVGISSARPSHSRAASLMYPQRRKAALTNAPGRKSKKVKINAERALAAPTPRGGSLSAADFDKSEWETIYPIFVEEGLVVPSKCVNMKDA